MEKNTVFVLDTNRKQLAPCCAARARILLRKGKAAVFRRYPFTIILKRAVEETPEPMSVKIDPGSRHTGMAIVAGDRVVWLGQIEHKTSIQEDMLKEIEELGEPACWDWYNTKWEEAREIVQPYFDAACEAAGLK